MCGCESTLVVSVREPDAIDRAADILRNGGLVAFPTDTVYGLGAHSGIAGAIERVYLVKGRMQQKAIPLLIGRTEDIEAVAEDVPGDAWLLAERFWPGGLTIVLRRKSTVLSVVTGGGATVAVRVPAHPVPLELIRALDAPIAGTSANRSGERSPTTADGVLGSLGGLIEMVIDGGPTPGGIESTVVDLACGEPVIRRLGAVPIEEIERVLGRPLRGRQ